MSSPSASLFRSVANRGVHIVVHPRPADIAESREILNILKQFGDVEYYRNLRFDARPAPNSALAIFKHERAAQRAIYRGVVKFRMGRKSAKVVNEPGQAEITERDVEERSDERTASVETPVFPLLRHKPASSGPFGMGQTRSLNTDSLPKPPRPPPTYPFHMPGMPEPEIQEEPEEDEAKMNIYYMHIRPSKVNFEQQAEMRHYHGSFMNDWRSAVNDDLRKRTPLKGMANLDWRKRTKSASVLKQERASIVANGSIGGLGEMYREALRKAGLSAEKSNTSSEER